jgi:hypothetical protein
MLVYSLCLPGEGAEMKPVSTTATRMLWSSFLIVVGWMCRRMADMMVVDGYQKAGYAYVMLDDCWSSLNRTNEGR